MNQQLGQGDKSKSADPLTKAFQNAGISTGSAPLTETSSASRSAQLSSQESPLGSNTNPPTNVLDTKTGVAQPSSPNQKPRRDGNFFGLENLLTYATDTIVRSGIPSEVCAELTEVINPGLLKPQSPVEQSESEQISRLIITSPAVAAWFTREQNNDFVVGSSTFTREGMHKLGALFFFASLIQTDPVVANDLLLHQGTGKREGVEIHDIRDHLVLVLKKMTDPSNSALRRLLSDEFGKVNSGGATAFLAGVLTPLFYINHRCEHPTKKGLLGFLKKKEETVPHEFRELGTSEPITPKDVAIITMLHHLKPGPKRKLRVSTTAHAPTGKEATPLKLTDSSDQQSSVQASNGDLFTSVAHPSPAAPKDPTVPRQPGPPRKGDRKLFDAPESGPPKQPPALFKSEDKITRDTTTAPTTPLLSSGEDANAVPSKSRSKPQPTKKLFEPEPTTTAEETKPLFDTEQKAKNKPKAPIKPLFDQQSEKATKNEPTKDKMGRPTSRSTPVTKPLFD